MEDIKKDESAAPEQETKEQGDAVNVQNEPVIQKDNEKEQSGAKKFNLKNIDWKKISWKKILGIVGNVVLYMFLILCIVAVVFSVIIKKNNDGVVNIFGYQARIVISDSMGKSNKTYSQIKKYKIKDIPIKSLIFIKTVPEDEDKAEEWYANLKVGDVLTFKYTYIRQETITHRIVDIYKKDDGSGWIIKLKGDNESDNTGTLEQTIDTSNPYSTNYVIGKVVGTNHLFGCILTFVKKPIGIVLLVILPCVIIIILEIIRLFTFFSQEKNKKIQSEKQQSQNEIEELKKKLAALEQGNQNNSNSQNNLEPKQEDLDNKAESVSSDENSKLDTNNNLEDSEKSKAENKNTKK